MSIQFRKYHKVIITEIHPSLALYIAFPSFLMTCIYRVDFAVSNIVKAITEAVTGDGIAEAVLFNPASYLAQIIIRVFPVRAVSQIRTDALVGEVVFIFVGGDRGVVNRIF